MLRLGLYLVPAFALYQQLITPTQKDQKDILDELSSTMSELKQWEKRLMELEMNDRDDEASENMQPEQGMYGLIPDDEEGSHEPHYRFISAKERKYASIYDELRHIILVIHSKTKELNASIKSYGFVQDEKLLTQLMAIMRGVLLLNLNKSTILHSCPFPNALWQMSLNLESIHYTCLETLISVSENKDFHLNILKSSEKLSENSQISIGSDNNDLSFYDKAISEICSNGLLGPIFNSIMYEKSPAIQRKARYLLDVISNREISHEPLMHRLDTFKYLVDSMKPENELITALVISRMYSNPSLFKTLSLHQNLPFINMLQNMYSSGHDEKVKKLCAIGLMIAKGKKSETTYLKEEERSFTLENHLEYSKQLLMLSLFGLLFRSSYFIFNYRLLSNVPYYLLLSIAIGETLKIEKTLTEAKSNYGWLHVASTFAIATAVSQLQAGTLRMILLPYLSVYFLGGLSLDSGKLAHQRSPPIAFSTSSFLYLDDITVEHLTKKWNRIFSKER
nr:unnamed protein product [Naegleria fowleri]